MSDRFAGLRRTFPLSNRNFSGGRIIGCSALALTLACLCPCSSPAVADEIILEDSDVNAGVVVSPSIVPASQPPMAVPSGDPAVPSPMPASPLGTAPANGEAANQASVKRPAADKYVPQSIDMEIRTNPDGKVAFNIKGQPWEPVLQWLADASALSLDWQELPGDSLNLITSREYAMEEARDLINRHLLSRGFTMIVNGEIMSIVRTKELNPAMVQRVTPEKLSSLPDHTMCKVSFNLDWLIADEAVEELKPMLSAAGQIHKLSRTNRLEIVDTAVSLRQIWELIESEQSGDGEEQLVRAFRLENRRAEDVIRMLRDLLKLQDSGAGGGTDAAVMDPNMGMQMMQQAQQMQQMQMQMQQAAAQAGTPGGAGPKAKVETRLVLNQRENMILAQAAPDQMAVIERAIEQIDVPGDNGRSLLQNLNRMKVYRLESVEPQVLADLLQQLGDLDPGTVLKVDKQKRSIIAWATLADHLTITTLVEKLDQSSRKIEVIALKRLDAEYVAGTIRLLMGNGEEKQEANPFAQRYGYFDSGQMNQQTPKEPSFKVEADTENNRLLVNANAIEMDEIRDLLIKLGELPDPNAANDGIRVFDLNPDEDLKLFRQQLERYWRRGNQLQFDLPDRQAASDSAPTRLESTQPESTAPDATQEKKPDAIEQDNAAPSAATENGGFGPAGTGVMVRSRRAPAPAAPSDDFDQLLAAHQAARKAIPIDRATILTQLTDENAASASPAENGASDNDGSEEVAAESTAAEDGAPVTPPAEAPAAEETPDPRISRSLIEKLRMQLRNGSLDENSEMPADKEAGPTEGEDAEPRAETVATDGQSSPIRISMTPDGKLIVSGSDPQALAEIEELIMQVVTPRRSFKVFRLNYATPSWVTLNLKDFFKAEEETKSTMEYSPYFGMMPAEKKMKGNRTLSKRRQPQFISDNFTSTILVRDADAKQLQTIEDLIAIYDVPEPSDTRSMRVTTIFRLENAKAASVAAAIKDVFRDLLSSNDKALEKDDKGQQRQGSGGLVTFLPGAAAKAGESEEEPIRFKGLLSIGIDESSNTLIVSSAGTLMETIGEMIESLDEAADSSSVVQVVKVDRSVDLALIQERLMELMKTPQPQQGQQPGQPVPGQPTAPDVQSDGEAVVPDGN